MHVDLIDGKFGLRRDGTEYSIAREPLDPGVTKDRIVLAFRSLEKHRLTEFGVG